MKHVLATLVVLASAVLPRTVAGDAASRDACGIDGWGWELGELVLQRELELSPRSKVLTISTYIGVGTQLVGSLTLVEGRALECGDSCFHPVGVPRKPGTPAECVAQRVRATVNPVRPVD
jgi:hypothetical protein